MRCFFGFHERPTAQWCGERFCHRCSPERMIAFARFAIWIAEDLERTGRISNWGGKERARLQAYVEAHQ